MRVRYFAAAEAALGREQDTVSLTQPSTIAQVIHDVAQREPQASEVLERCSFLVNGVATTDRSTPLDNSSELDVLPPFAGG